MHRWGCGGGSVAERRCKGSCRFRCRCRRCRSSCRRCRSRWHRRRERWRHRRGRIAAELGVGDAVGPHERRRCLDQGLALYHRTRRCQSLGRLGTHRGTSRAGGGTRSIQRRGRWRDARFAPWRGGGVRWAIYTGWSVAITTIATHVADCDATAAQLALAVALALMLCRRYGRVGTLWDRGRDRRAGQFGLGWDLAGAHRART